MRKLVLVAIAMLMVGCQSQNLTIKDHKASFLFDNGGTRVMNILAHNVDENQFNGVLNRCISNGDKVIYLYVGYNKGDGAGTTSFYVNDKFDSSVDQNKINLMKNRMKAIRKKNVHIVGWMFADDNAASVRVTNFATLKRWTVSKFTSSPLDTPASPITAMSFKDTESLKRCMKISVDNFDEYISEYVVALEADEYLSGTQVDQLAQYLKSITKDKAIGVHQVPSKYNYGQIGSIDKFYLQYGFNKSTSFIDSETKKVIGAVGKPVIAAEYDLSSDSPNAKARGDAAMGAGAKGTGNGRN